MTESKENICARCRRPKLASGAGSLTQWIVACQCDAIPEEPVVESPQSVQLCFVCGKRVADGRTGSFTQWVFRSDNCRCAVPGLPAEDVEQETVVVVEEEEDELEIAGDSFPTERYKPIAEVGRGAAGVVYRCKDRLLGKPVAVKCLRMLTREQLVNFQKEAKATSQLQHPYVVSVMDFGSTTGGAPYMVMEFVRGISLEQLQAEQGPLSVGSAVALFAKVADGLAHAHKRGIFHRDLKASNILLTGDDVESVGVKIIDFGVAALKDEHMVGGNTIVGTPAYMAADQACGLQFDERSEVYTLGCVLFEALTGRPPFVGETALETINMHANVEAPLLADVADGDFSPEIEILVARSLEKDPAKRFQSMSEFRDALLDVVVKKPVLDAMAVTDDAVLPPRFMLTEETERKNNTRMMILFATLFLIGAIVVFVGYLQHSEVPVIETKTVDDIYNALPDRILETGPSGMIERGQPERMKGNYYSQGANDADFEVFLNEPHEVVQLDISDADITDKTFKLLAEKTKLRYLLYLQRPIERDIVRKIAMIKSLEGVHFISNKMDANALAELRALPKLRWLSIGGGPKFERDAFDQIAQLPNLEIVYLKKARGMSLYGMRAICSLPKLNELALNSTNVNDRIIEPVFGTKLEAINVARTGVSPSTIKRLENMPTMMEIYDLDYKWRRRETGFVPEDPPNLQVQSTL